MDTSSGALLAAHREHQRLAAAALADTRVPLVYRGAAGAPV